MFPNLYIGGQISTLNLNKLKQHNIKRILKVNGVETFLNYAHAGIKVQITSIDDMPEQDLEPYLEETH